MATEKAFVTSAIQGIFISMGFAFLVLLISTRNLLIAIFSITSVTFVIVNTVAVMVYSGWELGVAESIAIVILIGLAVDYVIHLACDYTHSIYQSRFDKMQ